MGTVHIMTSSVIFLLFLCSDTLASDLFTIVRNPEVNLRDIPACRSKNVLNCSLVEIDFSALTAPTLTLPHDCTVTFLDSPSEGSFTFHDDRGTEATFTRGETKEGNYKLIGNVEYWDGQDFILEPCKAFPGCHVWMEMDVQQWTDLPTEALPVLKEDMRDAVPDRKAAKLQQGKEDNSTIVTYSVMFYYTIEFAAATEDIDLYVAQVVADTNQGYINSKIPLRVKAHCIEAANLHDIYNSQDMVHKFSCYKSQKELLNSADAATLLISNYDNCGRAFQNTFMVGDNWSTSTKYCALNIHTFGHEVGHNFGCHHDKIQGPNSDYSYGLGKHIEGTGFRTNMAYSAPGYDYSWSKINYYSNPDVMYMGVPTGTENENNARVLREHRFAFADNGDESLACRNNVDFPTSGCDGGNSCCKNGNCYEGEGDCDSNSDCYGDLVCGSSNCKSGWYGDRSSFEDDDDCCMVPAPGCDGGVDCCKNGECQEGEGDCDSACDCHGQLVCGTDNCITGFPGDRSSFEDWHDCCYMPVCDGGDNCCENGNCGEGEGDCDSNSDCNSNLVCGSNNCKTGWPGDRSSFDDDDNCCMVPNSGCDGGDDCCKDGNCGEGQGDCDSDSDCYGPLVCGNNNCKTGWPGDRSSFDDGDNCCMIKP